MVDYGLISQLVMIFGFFFGILAIALSGKWFMFGLKMFMAKLKYKNNAGLMFIKNKGGDFGIPKIINLIEEQYEEGKKDNKKVYPYNADQIAGFKMFSMPSVFFDDEDAKCSVGMVEVYQQSNDNGEPVEQVIPIKPSVSLRPAALKALIDSKALTQAIGELFKQNKTLLMVLVGLGIGIAITAYFSYEAHSNILPEILSTLKTVANTCGAVKLG
jgi:hypothetical protein